MTEEKKQNLEKNSKSLSLDTKTKQQALLKM